MSSLELRLVTKTHDISSTEAQNSAAELQPGDNSKYDGHDALTISPSKPIVGVFYQIMFLPTSQPPAEADIVSTLLASTSGHGSKNNNGGWSSLIGVVTAICGNILISFALNTQRYAHMRLSRDREAEQQEKRKAARRKVSTNYGTQQATVAQERAGQNAKYEPTGDAQRLENGTESDPLIPKVQSRRTSGETQEDDEDEEDSPKEKSYLKSPIWWTGIVLMVIGETGNFLAYGFAPASIVSPLGVVALISNCIIAPVFLGERFRWRDAIGVLIAIGGCVVVVLSASSSNPKLTPEAIWDLVTTWEFETYLGITIFLIFTLAFLSNKYGDKSILIDLGLVGLFGGYTALSTKGVASLLTYKIWRVITFPITYLLVAVLVFTAVMQIKYINRALQRFNSTMVIPTQFVLFTLSVILGSAVLYRDFERENTEDAIKFVSGCALTFFGVWCITSGRKQESEEESQPGDEEDAIDLIDEERAYPEIRGSEEVETRQSSFAAGSSQHTASLRRFHSATPEALQKSLRTPTMEPAAGTSPSATLDLNAKPLEEQMAHLAPADASAIHTTTVAHMNLGGDPDPQKKPPIHATTSEPLLPTTPNMSSALRPKTPLARTPSGPAAGSPLRRSPARASQYLDPHRSQRLQSRQSMVGLFPGPLTSPLSGSLSAIVADELRRGIDKSPFSSMKRRKTGTGPRPNDQPGMSKAATGRGLKRHSIASGTEIDFESEEAAEMRVAAGSPPSGRIRSLSATLSDLFGSGSGSAKRQRMIGAQEQRRQQSMENAVEEEEASRTPNEDGR